jgi:hypothetical protein
MTVGFGQTETDGTMQAEERHAQLLASCGDEDFINLEKLGFLQVGRWAAQAVNKMRKRLLHSSVMLSGKPSAAWHAEPPPCWLVKESSAPCR